MDYLKLKELRHSGIKGMKWGQRRFQNEDGTLTPEGLLRYGMRLSPVDSIRNKVKDKMDLVRTSDRQAATENYNTLKKARDAQQRRIEMAKAQLKRAKDSKKYGIDRKTKQALTKDAKNSLKTALKRKQAIEDSYNNAENEMYKIENNSKYSPTLDRQKKVIANILKITGKTAIGAAGGLDEIIKQKGFKGKEIKDQNGVTIGYEDKKYPKGLNGMVYKLQDAMSGGLTDKGDLKKGNAIDKLSGIGGMLTGAITGSGVIRSLNSFIETQLSDNTNNKKKVKHADYSNYILVNTSEGLGVCLMHKTVPQGKEVEFGPKGGAYYENDNGEKVHIGKNWTYTDNSPGQSENQNGKQNANNANPNSKQNGTPGPMTTAEMQKKLSGMYLDRSNQFKSLQGAGYQTSKMVGQISDTIPHVPGKKTYGNYDDIATAELKKRIDRINTERNYSDLIGDTKYTKSGADKLKEILGYAGSALAITATGIGLYASLLSMKGNKIKPS